MQIAHAKNVAGISCKKTAIIWDFSRRLYTQHAQHDNRMDEMNFGVQRFIQLPDIDTLGRFDRPQSA